MDTVWPPQLNTGSVTTEGDAILRSNLVRSTYDAKGNNIKIGIISDGVDNLSTSQNSGNLPSNVHVLSNAVHGDEGTAMLEIVHDIVPNAELYFHDYGSQSTFNASIDDLVNAGCKIICDDVVWSREPNFEDGGITTHINSAITTNNIVYVTSAGNYGDRHYQGQYYPTYFWSTYWHDFSNGQNLTYRWLFANITPSTSITVTLQWNDKWQQSANDYDLYIFNRQTSALLGSSVRTQNGDDTPWEEVNLPNLQSTDIPIMILVKPYNNPQSKILEVYISTNEPVYQNNIVQSDSITGHAASPNVVTVGAISANDPGNDEIEPYSSRGPVTLYFPSYTQRSKPNIIGIDRVSTSGPGGKYNPFWGTSAAAPHVAAIAAQTWATFPHKNFSRSQNCN